MKEYFTEENTINYFQRCSEQGINLFQGAGAQNFGLWERSKQSGETRHFIHLIQKEKDKSPKNIEYAKKNKFLGVAHHGEVTDSMFKKKELDKIEDF